ncbi:dihydrolipoyl dehydrogenase [Mycoplasma capricolum subsp. capripneumoniae]|uniref:Dihydrolipoamide dehydrogenase n=1 Tax=Mycoplasma capricolum subsp. capripneumoniae 87001 TaxID=1124992 RepID=A0A9N7ASN9_MYCCC|nr:dihydrolipoyl dehydrogenase [Mycoplasma capricolum]AJK51468.1 dihydrolipoamide dehydrogenase [Mycoplasma capricolum subsp. capripneumoniae 87001]AOQ22139.1 dihydrolipoyl dehydrogenase [Mycoplasma capricolum subsp. capripneumoniae M1601]AQU77517.1 dihydrolipoyl dehydrogenase [Mycoplasma capricolum subsp. capripneumoniae]KEY84505.1 Dihydrolipoyl dehydrogenase [Mycoplasma capricolum subsp. capripneumoniae 99108]QDL19604.1 dihydrolipoyl dehydrogenase [Mycoplasma capricolum subsp. capripneumonia
MEKFDVVVLGAGPGGYSLANILSINKLKVALIEKEDLGGTCINKGCIPTKTLIKSAKVFELVKNAKDYGVFTDAIKYDIKKIQQRRLENKTFFNSSIQKQLDLNNVRLFKGLGEVLDQNSIKVNEQIICFDKLVIATGSRSKIINFQGIEESIENGYLINSDQALCLESVPKSMVIIGDGPISLEFAYFYNTLGTKVTILTNVDFLSRFDIDIQKSVKQYFDLKNIKVIDKIDIKKIDLDKVYYDDNFIQAEKILLAIGRQPNNESFKNLDIKKDKNGFVLVDDLMKTNFDNIYAIGDITGLTLLSSVAYKTGDIVARNILKYNNSEKFDKNLVPWAIYLNPEIAGVGLTEQQLVEQKVEFESFIINSKALPRTHADGIVADYSFIKFLVDKKTDQILGCFMMIETANILINQIALFMQQKLTFTQLQKSVYTHPTIAEALYYSSRIRGIKSK